MIGQFGGTATVVGMVMRHQDRTQPPAFLVEPCLHWPRVTRIDRDRIAGFVRKHPDVVVGEGGHGAEFEGRGRHEARTIASNRRRER